MNVKCLFLESNVKAMKDKESVAVAVYLRSSKVICLKSVMLRLQRAAQCLRLPVETDSQA